MNPSVTIGMVPSNLFHHLYLRPNVPTPNGPKRQVLVCHYHHKKKEKENFQTTIPSINTFKRRISEDKEK